MNEKFPQKRLSLSFQLVIATSPQGEPDFPEGDTKLLASAILEGLSGIQENELKFEPYGIGRGAGGGAWGIDLTVILNSLNAMGAIKSTFDIANAVYSLTKKVKKKFSNKKTIVYSKTWLEHYSIGYILKNTDEQELKTAIAHSLTGSDIEQYEHIDYYLFLFSAEDRNFLVLIDASANIVSCQRITAYKGVENLKF